MSDKIADLINENVDLCIEIREQLESAATDKMDERMLDHINAILKAVKKQIKQVYDFADGKEVSNA